METMNNALKFLTQKHYELLEQKSTLEKMRQDLKSSIDQVFANQENIQTKPDIHLHTVEIQKLASALKNG
jgi:prefoldin subunit 5